MTYMTAAELGISQAEHDALAELVPYFRTQVCTIPERDATGVGIRETSSLCEMTLDVLGFHMNFGAGLKKHYVEKKYDCGCVACIGGHVSLRMQGLPLGQRTFTGAQLIKANQYVMALDPREDGEYQGIKALYYPNNAIRTRDWDNIRPDLASDAIVNFLTTGDADWRSIGEANDLSLVDGSDEDEDE